MARNALTTFSNLKKLLLLGSPVSTSILPGSKQELQTGAELLARKSIACHIKTAKRGKGCDCLLQLLRPETTPEQPLAGSPKAGDPGSVLRLEDTAATLLFADSTRDETQHVSQRHTHRMLTQSVTQTATDKRLPSPAPTHSNPAQQTHSSPFPPLWLAETAAHQCSTHTALKLQKHTCKH